MSHAYQRPGSQPDYPSNSATPDAPAGSADDRNFRIVLQRHSGYVVLFHMQNYTVTGTLAECEKAYRDAQIHNLLVGWWSLLSLFVFNWIALWHNVNSIRYIRRIAEALAGPPADGSR